MDVCVCVLLCRVWSIILMVDLWLYVVMESILFILFWYGGIDFLVLFWSLFGLMMVNMLCERVFLKLKYLIRFCRFVFRIFIE